MTPNTPATVLNLAAYVVERLERVGCWKLHALVYYAQAWSLAWDDRPLFDDPIHAWPVGPVAPTLHEALQGTFECNSSHPALSNPTELDDAARETVAAVLDYYSEWRPQQLSDLTRAELPWQKARRGLSRDERGDHPIHQDDMAAYYASLPDDERQDADDRPEGSKTNA